MERPFPAYAGDGPYVFICYAHADAGEVYPELIWLRETGINVWYDEGISPGAEFPEELGQAILGASLLLFYASPDSVSSRHCRDEVYFALDRKVPVLTLHLKPFEMPPGLALSTGTTQAILRHGEREAAYRDKLLHAISTAGSDTHRGPAPAGPGAGRAQARRRRRLLVFSALTLAIIAGLLGGNRFLEHQAQISWARNEAMPEIRAMIEERWSDYTEPYALAAEVEQIIPDDPALAELFDITARHVDITSDPPGAEVYYQRYAHPEESWQPLGRTPIKERRLPIGIFRWRFEKDGFAPVMAAHSTWDLDLAGEQFIVPNPLHRVLTPLDDAPEGMVRVSGAPTAAGPVEDFWIDHLEVTNRDYQAFVQAGGYARRELWAHPFEERGEALSWEDAMARFVDQSGRPGPSTWVGGTYPDGKGDHPVSGVSWYEAAAYARFKDRTLPTNSHWGLAQGENQSLLLWPQLGGMGLIVPFSNFLQTGTRPVGSLPGITSWGANDMAGNVREWCWNETDGGRLVRGGGYPDNPYRFTELSQAPPMTREGVYGFRTALLAGGEPAAELAGAVTFPHKQQLDVSNVADDALFGFIARQFDYDERPLAPRLEARTETDQWVLQRVVVESSYGEELVINLFLPRNAAPPYQTVVYFPGSGSLFQASSADIADYYEYPTFLSFLVKTGRAVAFPVYQGTFERYDPKYIPIHLGGGSNAYRQYFVELVQDVRRTLDYLDTREDVDRGSYTFYGMSWGAIFAAIVPAVEPRIRATVLLGGGYVPESVPETNPVHFAPRVQVPLLMLVGRYDSMINFERAVKPLFQLLGTAPDRKRLEVYETDHVPPKTAFITEILGWLDEVHGTVDLRPALEGGGP